MSEDIDMSTSKVTNLATPTANADVTTKKYVDDREPKFKDGTTTTSDVDLRESSGSLTFYDDVTFHAGAKCKNLFPITSSKAVVNKNSLETGGLVGIRVCPRRCEVLSRRPRKRSCSSGREILTVIP